MISEYPFFATHAIKIILPFSTTYLCKSGFSALVQLKSTQMNRLDIEHDLRVALSTITPDFETLLISFPVCYVKQVMFMRYRIILDVNAVRILFISLLLKISMYV